MFSGPGKGKKKERSRSRSVGNVNDALKNQNNQSRQRRKRRGSEADIADLTSVSVLDSDLSPGDSTVSDIGDSDNGDSKLQEIKVDDGSGTDASTNVAVRRSKGPRDWSKVKGKVTKGNLTHYGNPLPMRLSKMLKHGAPLNQPDFQGTLRSRRKEEDKIVKATQKGVKKAFAKGLQEFKNKNNPLKQRLYNKGIRLYDHDDQELSPLVAEQMYYLGTGSKSQIRQRLNVEKDFQNQFVFEAVPFVKVHDLYITPAQAGNTAWRELVETLHQTDPQENNKFVVISGSHMQQMGMVKDQDGNISYLHATDALTVGGGQKRHFPVEFYAQDLLSSEKLVGDNPDLQIEVRDIWHPDLDSPTPESLRAEITQLIAQGWKVIVPACFSCDMFMPLRDHEPQNLQEKASFTQSLIAERNKPFSEFVPKYYGNLDDFAGPKADADAKEEKKQEEKDVAPT